MDAKTLIVFLAIGLVAGFLAIFVMGGGGLITYLVSGVLGSFVGGYLLSAIGVNLGIGNKLLSQIVTSTIGPIVVLFIARILYV